MRPTFFVHGSGRTLGRLEGSSSHICAVYVGSVRVALEGVLVLDSLSRLLSYRCRTLLSRQLLVSDTVHRLSVHEIAEKVCVCCTVLPVI